MAGGIEMLQMDNDTRGWIMSVVSGLACMTGAGIIYSDKLLQLLPGWKDFQLQESEMFMAGSLSLSFGVMIFLGLYSMLPQSKNYLLKAGYTPKEASWALLGGFALGFGVMQCFGRLHHKTAPSTETGCTTHSERGRDLSRNTSRRDSYVSGADSNDPTFGTVGGKGKGKAAESTPLLPSRPSVGRAPSAASSFATTNGTASVRKHKGVVGKRRPSMIEASWSFLKDTKTNCDSAGPCYGYSDPCGHECLSHDSFPAKLRRPNTVFHSTTGMQDGYLGVDLGQSSKTRPRASTSANTSLSRERALEILEETIDSETEFGDSRDLEAQIDPKLEPGHHHKPENPLLDSGLQSVISIAIHKFPEGFITYATNHASPALGWSVFIALFVHSIVEGFVMAMPLAGALGSRGKAFTVATIIGGLTQPLGAGVAALWFNIAGKQGAAPSATVYGIMFSITSGIMTSVALTLFMAGLKFAHNPVIVTACAFFGIFIMGSASALTAS